MYIICFPYISYTAEYILPIIFCFTGRDGVIFFNSYPRIQVYILHKFNYTTLKFLFKNSIVYVHCLRIDLILCDYCICSLSILQYIILLLSISFLLQSLADHQIVMILL